MQAEVYLNLKAADSLQTTVARERPATRDQPGYIGNCNILIKNMVTWQEHHSSIESQNTAQFLVHTQRAQHSGLNCEGRMSMRVAVGVHS